MCKLIRLFLLSLAVVSCQKPLFSNLPRSLSRDEERQPRKDSTVTPALPEEEALPDLYASAFVFPDGVDWQDESPEEGEIVLFKNGKPLVRVPFSGPPEPDRHRISDGRLWTDSCDGQEVIVSRDGMERFRFAGDELFRGFLVVNGIVYTLGQRQGNEGLCFRVNGEERFSAPTGTILGGPDDSEWEGGAFSRDTAGVCYTYGIPFRKGDRLQWEYRVMREDEICKIIPAGSVDAIFDIRVHDGIVYRSELRTSIRDSYCLVKDETYYTVEMASSEVPHYCKLVPVDGSLLLKGYSTGISSSKKYTFWLRDPAEIRHIAIDNQPIRDMASDGKHTAYLVESPEGLVRSAYLDAEQITFTSDRYRLPYARCLQMKKGCLGLALSSPDGQEHLLVRNKEAVKLQFNGCFTSVQIH